MAMIRNQQAARMAEDAIVLDLGDLRRQAEQMKARAKAEADQIIAHAHDEAKRLTEGAEAIGQKAGHAAGYAEGLEAGRVAGHAEALETSRQSLEKLQEAWVNAARQWDDDRRQMVLEARQSVLELAVRMAEKIVHRVPHVEPSVVQDQVEQAISHVTGPCDVSIRIHPADRDLVEEALGPVTQQLSQVRHASLIEDEAVGRGGCVVSHGTGRIDATLETQLTRLVTTLLPEATVVAEDEQLGAVVDPAEHAERADEAADEADGADDADGKGESS
ncbi:MAG: FliH/SctL family protein [Phycisphaeraceae bacterium]